ncbi:flagellar biosynthesis protein FlhA [Myxococcota bacterium]|nr:flagellar biosynthesis protein FlhA [Myxococcota bacterium]MBU1429364.1 flagellar biosynthesis protein FlhA [Myxococcota bacterium]MBU1899885.1 flagellar biosynthesis protein FlhA [Myxococcota bacterium]
MGARFAGVIFPSAVVAMLLLMVIPIPTFLLDVFLAFNITLGLIILVVALYLQRPLDFSSFPALLLVSTLFRLTLNIASTRLILLDGDAGAIINTFGDFVVGGNYVVGIIVFVILVIINFVVITKGSGRIAEVGARFTLDAMPGKQMAIDADLNAGLLDEATARKRREEIQMEADFYGAMDGASKFVRGDAIAGIMITIINIIGGFIIGMTQHGLPAAEAAAKFTILTVGDGLVSQIPALVISTAAGIIVSRAAGSSDLGGQLIHQLFSSKKVLRLVGVMLAILALAPGMPKIIFFTIAGLLIFASRAPKAGEAGLGEGGEPLPALEGHAADGGPPLRPEAEPIEALLPLDLLELEVGYGLIPLVDRGQGGALLDRIQNLRRQFASQMGVIIPSVHIRDNLQRPPGGYAMLIKGVDVAVGELMPDHLMAMNPGDAFGELPGVATVEPAFGMAAVWITKDLRAEAERMGYTVVDSGTVIATHISEVLKNHAHELLGRQELQELIDLFAEKSPKVVEALIPDKLGLGEVLKVARNLLKEQLSIRDLRTILEALADHVHLTKSPEILTEFVRHRLARYISSQVKGEDGEIHVITLEPALEERLRGQMQQMDESFHFNLPQPQAERLLSQLDQAMSQMGVMGYLPVLLVAPELRRATYNLLSGFMSDLVVISHKEIAPGFATRVEARVSG